MLVPEYGRAVAEDPTIDPGLDVADAIGIALYRLGR
jgi:hypothetical protein